MPNTKGKGGGSKRQGRRLEVSRVEDRQKGFATEPGVGRRLGHRWTLQSQRNRGPHDGLAAGTTSK